MNRNSSLAVLAAMAVTVAAGGCKSDLNQQLLERELRMQEDQIYQLQDELLCQRCCPPHCSPRVSHSRLLSHRLDRLS